MRSSANSRCHCIRTLETTPTYKTVLPPRAPLVQLYAAVHSLTWPLRIWTPCRIYTLLGVILQIYIILAQNPRWGVEIGAKTRLKSL